MLDGELTLSEREALRADNLDLIDELPDDLPDLGPDPESILFRLLREAETLEASVVAQSGQSSLASGPALDPTTGAEAAAEPLSPGPGILDRAESLTETLATGFPQINGFSYEYLKTEHDKWVYKCKQELEELAKEAESKVAKVTEEREKELDKALVFKLIKVLYSF